MNRPSLIVSMAVVFLACSSEKPAPIPRVRIAAPTPAGPTNANAPAAPPSAPATPVTLPFAPSNLTLTGFDGAKAGDVSIQGANCVLDSERMMWSCGDGGSRSDFHVVMLSDGSRAGVYLVRSLRVEPNTELRVQGAIPLIIVALSTVNVLGSILVPPGMLGGGTPPQNNGAGGGPGAGRGATVSGERRAGSGGAFCGVGGAGGAEQRGTPNAKSAPYGTLELVPLVAGSAGGAGAIVGVSARGGGAIQIVAGSSIVVEAGGAISAPGGGGSIGALAGSQEASGGGSGGAVLLEAPIVRVAGSVVANGGGGGQGDAGDVGEDGHSDGAPALGGQKDLGRGRGSHGGNGSAGDDANGADGSATANNSAGGGGGGAGRIRVDTRSGTPEITGRLSPSVASHCASFGTLH